MLIVNFLKMNTKALFEGGTVQLVVPRCLGEDNDNYSIIPAALRLRRPRHELLFTVCSLPTTRHYYGHGDLKAEVMQIVKVFGIS